MNPITEEFVRDWVRKSHPITREDWAKTANARGTSDFPSKSENRVQSGRAGRKSHNGKWRTTHKAQPVLKVTL